MATKTLDAIHMLKEDHVKVKDLFEDFESTEDVKERKDIAEKAIQELEIHTMLEEEIFYPAVREATEEEDLMNEAEEEHHVAKVLIEELKKMEASSEHFPAKFMVLAENVRHHIKEEESEMLPKAKKSDADMEELGQLMMQRKQQLMGEMGASRRKAA
jgi:hypothetical protein